MQRRYRRPFLPNSAQSTPDATCARCSARSPPLSSVRRPLLAWQFDPQGDGDARPRGRGSPADLLEISPSVFHPVRPVFLG